MRLDSTRGAALGGLEKIIDTPTKQESASLSADGHLVAYASARTGKMNIWVRGMADGKETRVASMPLAQRYPVSNAAGSRIAFSVFEKNGARSVYVSNPAGSPEKVCDGCFRATDWSRDGDSLLVFEGNPYEVSTLNLASHQRMTLLKSAAHSLLYAHYSPDNKWVSFTERLDAHRARIMIAPVTGTKEIPESAWIQIAEVWPEDWANWSSDGRTLYFTSPRDGHFCFWGQRLDPISHRPAGDPFAVLHLHGRLAYEQAGWSIGGGQLAMVATEDTGDIWLMTRAKPVATAPQDSR
jgi:Tol biopolymer transport system component